MTLAVVFEVLAVVALIVAAVSYHIAELHGKLARLNRLVASMLRNPDRMGELAAEYAEREQRKEHR